MKLKKLLITLSIFLLLISIAVKAFAMTYFENVGSNTRNSYSNKFKC